MLTTKIPQEVGTDTGNWIQIGSQQQCVGGFPVCSNDQINYTNKNDQPDPCMAENTCTGTVQVIVEDSNANPLENLLVTRDDASNKTTDEVGTATYNLTKTCGQDLEFVVKCSDNATYCGTKSTALDFIGDFDSLSFDCTVCTGNVDLRIDLGDVTISTDTNAVTVNITVENVDTVSGVNLTIKAQDKDSGLISYESSKTFAINSGDKFHVETLSINLNNIDYIHVYVDATNKVNEPKTNNYVAVPVITNKRKAFISVDTGNSFVDNAIEDYLKLFVISTSDGGSSLTIAVGLGEHNSIINSKKSFTQSNFRWYVDSRSVYFDNKPIGSRPWIGLVGGFRENMGGDDYVFAMGTDIEGVVAATKRLVNARDKFFVPQLFDSHTSIIEDTDTLGISVMDLMHNAENKDKYNKRNSDFQKVVERILTDNNFEIAIKTVKTYNDNTTLRLKNVNSDFSDNYKDAVVGNRTPVVFSGGIFSNLFSWEEDNGLARELANEGYDTWEIEITGGPMTECDSCSDYTYSDLVDYYWPASIAGVVEYAGQNQIDYIGHSNGCRVALSSLNSYSGSGKSNAGHCFNTATGLYDIDCDLPSNVVDKFIGLGCPITLNDTSGTSELAREIKNGIAKGYTAINKIRENNLHHIKRQDYAKHLNLLGLVFGRTNEKISTNLMDFYNNISIEADTSFSIQSDIVTESVLFAGTKGYFGLNHFGGDGVVPLNDMQTLNSYLDGSSLYTINTNHGDLITDSNVKSTIRGELNE